MTTAADFTRSKPSAVLDDAHIGDIRGAFGTILDGDVAPRRGWWARLRTLLAILGPGLIVMVGDNDAGAFGTYAQAGQDCGTALLWTLLLLIPVFLWVHPPLSQIGHDLLVPRLPHGGKASEVMLLIIATVGTTIAPWNDRVVLEPWVNGGHSTYSPAPCS